MARSIKPFDDSQEKDRRRSSTNSSTDTSPVDAFRQGVELTRTVHYANGIVKIHSGYNGQSGNHEVPQFVLGQDRPSHRDENSFLEGIRLDPLTRFEDGLFEVSAPTVSAIDLDLGDTQGGELRTLTGTNFTGTTSVTVDGTAVVSFSVISATELLIVMPAHAAGASQSILVTTPGGTNAANTLFEYWDPTVPASATSFLESPDYAPGTWTARVGPTFTEATNYPDNNPTGTPDFKKVNNDFLSTSTQTVTFIGSTSHTAGCTFALVIDLTSLPTAGNYSYLWSDWNGTGAYTGVLIDDIGTAYMSFYDGSFASAVSPQKVAIGRNVLVGRKIPNGANSLAYMQVNGVQGSSVARGDLTVAGGGVYLGQNPYAGGLYKFDGKMLSVVTVASNWSDVDVAKFYKWAAARHP